MILLFHQIILFITKTFTKPTTVDLVNKPTEIYDDIYETINKTDLLPPKDISTEFPQNIKNNMQVELQEYLNDLTKEKNIEDTPLPIISENNEKS